MLLAAPLSIAIGLFLSELAPPAIRGPIGSLIEMLAAVPSVVIGLWGILVLGPFMRADIEPFLHDYFGWIPIFGGAPPASGGADRDRRADDDDDPDHLVDLPRALRQRSADVKEASIGLGATRWEMVRGVVVPYVKGGVVAAVTLGLGRALGEAIAVTQVIGNTTPPAISRSSRPATRSPASSRTSYQGARRTSRSPSLVYLGLILLVITFVSNLGGAAHRPPVRVPADGRVAWMEPIPCRRPGARRRLRPTARPRSARPGRG